MAPITQEIVDMLDMLPEQEQALALEVMKRLVLAWDADYTKLTPAERKRIEAAKLSGFVDEKNIDWDNLSKYSN